MSDIETMFEHLFLKAADLKGGDVTLTIDKVQREIAKTDKGQETAVVLYFKEIKDKMIQLPDAITGKMVSVKQDAKKLWLNKTNGRVIGKMHGNVADWAGNKITLYPTTTKAMVNGKYQTVECIRIRENK